ncbi:hypothetical protein [Arthrobacter sp. B3I4]|uniref:hypothetical protein n=1 Tax=Arthrobacter sp. B3I4 TaxID=3042267 RepID=UPI0027868379|nr:hypothetical protein [Arthrobacter sp. B3I4]MDQ0754890.1 hypothetical protein [Arthrobacter sp. B3I4]
MQFDISAVETSTMVFAGTLVFAMTITAFILTAAFAALALLGVGRLAWFIAASLLLGLVHGINETWDRLLHHARRVELPSDFPGDLIGQPSPSTGTYPRVVLRDS